MSDVLAYPVKHRSLTGVPVDRVHRRDAEEAQVEAAVDMTATRCSVSSRESVESLGMVICDRSVQPLSQLEVLVIDCQATAAAPRGHLLEIAWARSRAMVTHVRAHLIALSRDEKIPPAVARITGISEPMMRDGVDPEFAWRELADDAVRLTPQPAPTVIHFARFEQPFLRTLAGGDPPLDIVCTHDIARRLFPDLPRRSLRAVAGYLGRGVGALRRSADHVEATAFLWQELVHRLEEEGVATWGALREWLAMPVDSRKRPRRVWPMPREMRLSLPKSPGVYRMLRTSGDVLYVGKASSLHDRVNSHFRKQHGVDERTLEMLSQARAISFDVTTTPLEAALLETDEIKRHRPPYNLALTIDDRALWFASPDLSERSSRPSQPCPLGPLVSVETLDRFGALARADRAALASGRWGPDAATFHAGYERLCATHGELSHFDLSPHARLLRLGTRLWRMDAAARARVTGVARAAGGARAPTRAVVDAPTRCERGVARARCHARAPDGDRTRRDRA